MWYNIPVIKKELKTVNLPCLSMDRVKMSDPSPEYFSKHCHDRYEYIFFVQADCEYVVESKVYRVRSGDSILIPPGKYHFLRTCNMKKYERAVFSFTPELFPDPTFIDEVVELGQFFPSSEYPESNRIAGNFLSECRQMSPRHSALYAAAALTEIFLFLISAPRAEKPAEGDDLCSKAVNYIAEHLSEIRSTDDIAKGLYSSRSALQHSFRKNMDIPVMQYVRIKRLFAVRQYLTSGLTLTAASEKAGYDDYTTFYRAYKAHFGYPPTKEKKAVKR